MVSPLLNKLVDTTVSSLLEDLETSLPVTNKIPQSWEMVHRFGDYGRAIALSTLTNSPKDIHLQFTPERQKIIHLALQGFNTLEVAAGLAMIEVKTLKTWLRLGEYGFQPYHQFMLEVNRSKAMAEAADNEAISRSSAQFKLERLKLRSPAWRDQSQGTNINIENHTETTINNSPLIAFKNEERKRIIEEMLLGIDLDDSPRIIDHI